MAHTFAGVGRCRQPIGAVALLALGFLAARFTGGGMALAPRGGVGADTPAATSTASLAPSDDVFATVRSVQPDSTGHVRVVFDETRRREISGGTEDRAIQKLLLAAAHEDNPAVRVESVDLLKNGRARPKCATRC